MLLITKNYSGRLTIRKAGTTLTFPKDIKGKASNRLYILNNFLKDKIFRKEEKIFPKRNLS